VLANPPIAVDLDRREAIDPEAESKRLERLLRTRSVRELLSSVAHLEQIEPAGTGEAVADLLSVGVACRSADGQSPVDFPLVLPPQQVSIQNR
jgi:hypothetical protein